MYKIISDERGNRNRVTAVQLILRKLDCGSYPSVYALEPALPIVWLLLQVMY